MKIRISRLLFSLSILSLLFSGGVPLSYAHAIQPASTPGLVDGYTQDPIGLPAEPSLDQRVYLPLMISPIVRTAPVAVGMYYSCALTASGGVKCWGDNEYGQLGDGTTTQRLTPVYVSGLTRGVRAISASYQHTCALTRGGGVKCWGYNWAGQLGDGTTESRHTPVDVVGLGSGVIAIAAGATHTCALTESGAVKCWGDNKWGQLGDGTTESRHTPVDVVGLGSEVAAIAAGSSYACALTEGGGVKCWGFNPYGQLGDGTTDNQSTPVDVVGLSSGVTAITAGGFHTCALTVSGGVMCWGYNFDGQLGDGTVATHYTPVDVMGLANGMVAIAAGSDHTCALTVSGGARCWGNNRSGQLGDGTTIIRYAPEDVAGLSSGVTTIAAGFNHTCALTESGSIKCWGDNWYGEVGDGTKTTDPFYQPQPMDVAGLSSGVMQIAAGGEHTCALVASGGARCWGRNVYGQLGDGTTENRLTPVSVVGLPKELASIAAGRDYTCALTANGGVKCWGDNFYGKLGDGTTETRHTPVDVVGLSSGVVAIAAGEYHTCALTVSGSVKCWGLGDFVGDGSAEPRLTPVDVVGLSSGVTAIVAGESHTCALTESGGVKCWGWNSNGQLGNGSLDSSPFPVDVSGLTEGVIAISAGGAHTCALTASGAKCWGSDYYGQIGDGVTAYYRQIPVDVLELAGGATGIAAGGEHTCALTASGGIQCWGWNYAAQLGDGTTTDRHTPVDVTGLTNSEVTAITAGGRHTCTLTASGGAKCWGLNEFGQLGDGSTPYRYTPVDVVGFGEAPTALR